MKPHRTALRAAAALFVSLLFGAEMARAADGAVTQRFMASAPGSTITVDHAAWDKFLKTYLSPGKDGVSRLDYARVNEADRAALASYVASLAMVDVDGLNRAEQYAFWANLYNALTVKIILDHYPVDSIRDIKLGRLVAIGPWGKDIITVDGVFLSLDDIEHAILRPIWKDPRTHYAVNCASLGCPNLQPDAFTAANRETLLEAGAKAYVNHPRGARVSGDALKVSSIYKWFREDFGDSEAGVIAHLKQYAEGELASQLASRSDIDGYAYDWSLNDTRNERDARN